MPQLQHHITFRCRHQEISTVKGRSKSIRSKIKCRMHGKKRTSASLCSTCVGNPRRYTPSAKGTQTLAAIALACQGNSLPELRAGQIRCEEMAALIKSKHVEEFSNDHQVSAAEAEQALEQIEQIWKKIHSDHVNNAALPGLRLGEWGPHVCPLCEEVLRDVLGPSNQADRCTKPSQGHIVVHRTPLSPIREDEEGRDSETIPLLQDSINPQAVWQNSQPQVSSNESKDVCQVAEPKR